MEEIDAYASSRSSPLQIENTIRVAMNTASTQATEGALAFDGVWYKIAPVIRQSCTAKEDCRESGFRWQTAPEFCSVTCRRH